MFQACRLPRARIFIIESFTNGARAKRFGSVVVDTNGDQSPDTLLSSTSNFSPGLSPDLFTTKYYEGECPCYEDTFTCHYDANHEHCYYAQPPGCMIKDC